MILSSEIPVKTILQEITYDRNAIIVCTDVVTSAETNRFLLFVYLISKTISIAH